MISRRQFIKLSAAASAGLILPVSLQNIGVRRAGAEAIPPVGPSLALFKDPLPIPGVLSPMGKLKGATYYEVTMDEVQQMVHTDMPGPTTF